MLYTVKIISNTAQKEPKNPLHMAFFVIKKKTFKKAVDRNRVKRRAKKAFVDALKEVDNHMLLTSSVNTKSLFFKHKKLIFFIEHDMIQELYSHIVLKIKEDIIQALKKYTN